ncbi:LysR family transcriptional regulator [Grimontia kaedaensis]|uniref:LysR family transcriptional regulator n=1 Tax=Grimontia kaedaensis TaxID=2872157 RepID=A0ABY4X2U4_9GAMM|nr:LysR family transcriptional regulator [Grimontia kaedaensis]USH05515.1 LysR family transcriptional regulator [Grimontia kaedaensis]
MMFLATAELGSLNEAAKAHGMSKSKFSRRISQLEEDLGVKLFHRVSNRLLLTQAGMDYQQYCSDWYHLSKQLPGRELVENRGYSGRIRLSIPIDLATTSFTRILNYFCELYPDVEIDCAIASDYSQLAIESYDVAFIINELPLVDANYIVQKLATLESGLYISPCAMKAIGKPKSISDLANFPCISHASKTHWTFKGKQGHELFEVKRRFSIDSITAQLIAAKDHLGLVRLPKFYAKQSVANRELTEIHLDKPLQPFELFIVYQERTLLSRKVRTLIEFMKERKKELSDPEL